jgi:hypothetical protein
VGIASIPIRGKLAKIFTGAVLGCGGSESLPMLSLWSFIFECTNIVPYSPALPQRLRLPVFSIYTS